MNIDKKLAVIISGVVSLLTTMRDAPVSAATFDFSYSGVSALDSNDTVTASGVFTTDPYDPATKSYKITSITGTRNGTPIDSLLSPSTFLDNDNLLFTTSPEVNEYGFAQLDGNGFAYTIGGQSYDIFHSYAYIEIDTGTPASAGYPLTSFSATPVPEPSSILGILGISALSGGTLLKRYYRSLHAKKSTVC